MSNYVEPQAFKACYAQYQKADQDRDILFAQLLDGYESLHHENTKIQEQLESERETRMMWQDSARIYKKELTQTKLATVSLLSFDTARPQLPLIRIRNPTPL